MWYRDTFKNDTRFGSKCLRKQLKLLVLALGKRREGDPGGKSEGKSRYLKMSVTVREL